VYRLLLNPQELSALRDRARALGHPDAAAQIVSRVLAPLLAKS
jgi:UDP-N-acetylglucosamine:LPS N-acetylglucosamine transferase